MKLEIKWTERARLKFREAAFDFEEKRHKLGLTFMEEVETALDNASDLPLSNPQVVGKPESICKILIKRFGYWVIYECHPDHILVLIVWAAIQKPGSWQHDAEASDP